MPDGIELYDNETVALASAEYINALGTLIQSTPNRTLVNFIVWRVVDKYSNLLGVPKKYYNGSNVRHSERCFEFVFNNLPISVNAQWVRNYVDRATKPEVARLVASMKEEFQKLLETVEWFDEETRSAALTKIKHMTSLVGYPDEFWDNEKLFEVYENVTIDETKLFETVQLLNLLDVYEEFRVLHDPIDKNNWATHSYVAVINAFYFAMENNISKGSFS